MAFNRLAASSVPHLMRSLRASVLDHSQGMASGENLDAILLVTGPAEKRTTIASKTYVEVTCQESQIVTDGVKWQDIIALASFLAMQGRLYGD
jgi:hypothetical protein